MLSICTNSPGIPLIGYNTVTISPVFMVFFPAYFSLLKGTITSSGSDSKYLASSFLNVFLSSPSKEAIKSISPKSCLVEVLYEPDTLADLKPGTLLKTLSIYSLTVFSTADLGILLPPADPDIM